MASIVAYSGSESDDEISENVIDLKQKEQQLCQTASLDVNKPVHSPSVVPEIDLSLSTTTPTEDFFGLDGDSSDDSIDNPISCETHFAKRNNVWSKPIYKTTNFTKSSSAKETVTKSKITYDTKQTRSEQISSLEPSSNSKTIMPKSEFWQGQSKLENWRQPETIWKLISNPDNKSSQKRVSSPENIAYSSKRKKTDFTCCAQVETLPLIKNCLFIHHNISKALHCSQPCQPPNRKYVSLIGHVGAVNRVKWCKPEFSHILASASMDTKVKIWNVFSTSPDCIQTLSAHTKAVKDIAWSLSGKEILSCGYDRTARLTDVVKGVELTKFEHKDFLTCIKYHPVNCNYILAGSRNIILCWDIRCPEKCVKTFGYKHNFGQVQDIEFIRDGHEFVISTDVVSKDSADRSIMVYDFASRVVLSNQVYQERYVCPRLAVNPHQAEMMAQSSGDYISLFSTIKPYKMNKCKRFEGHKVLGYSVGCGYSYDGRLVVSGNSDSTVIIWDYNRAIKLKQLGDKDEIYMDVAWHPVLRSTIASSTWGGHIDVWQ